MCAVYMATFAVPKGRVTTYKRIAEALDCGSSQAIGQALKRNPFAPVRAAALACGCRSHLSPA